MLDIHPLGVDMAVRAGRRGLGFVDTRKFARVIAAMDEAVDVLRAEGLIEELRTARRHIVERFDDDAEALEEADSWQNLRLPAAVRDRLRAADERSVELVDTVRYRLFATCAPDAER